MRSQQLDILAEMNARNLEAIKDTQAAVNQGINDMQARGGGITTMLVMGLRCYCASSCSARAVRQLPRSIDCRSAHQLSMHVFEILQ